MSDLSPVPPQESNLKTRDTKEKVRRPLEIPSGLQWLREFSVPIVGVLIVLLTLCLVAHYSSIKINWSVTKDFTGSIQSVVQTFAFVVGGIWAYYKFVKGRSFQDSLSPAISGRFALIDQAVYLVISIQIKNAGSTKVDFNHKGSAVIIYEYTATSETEIHTVADTRLTAFDLFNPNEKYIEPNEVIELRRFIAIPGPVKVGYRIEVEILSTSGFTWTATAIVDKASMSDNRPALIGL
jgi:hypothetical protein